MEAVSLDANKPSPPQSIQSHVPLKPDELENDEVRALAVKLAPEFEAADALFAVPPEFRRASTTAAASEDDDDSMDDELQHLDMSEQLLRQELELAQDFSALFNRNRSFEVGEAECGIVPPPPLSMIVSGRGEADVDVEAAVPLETSLLQPIPIPAVALQSPDAHRPNFTEVLVNQNYTNAHHFDAIRLTVEDRGGWYSMDWTGKLAPQTTTLLPVIVKEFCVTIPEIKLKKLFLGLPDTTTTAAVATDSSADLGLPVRTVAIRIRPDVLCGAVMDAVAHAMVGRRIQKRQGGHLQATVGPVQWTVPTVTEVDDEIVEQNLEIVFPAFFLDAQLCTYKSDHCERMLLLRIYHHDPASQSETSAMSESVLETVERTVEEADVEQLRTECNSLREACSLIQRIESPKKTRRLRSGSWSSPASSSKKILKDSASDHLLTSYRACPSVNEGGITLPSLNSDDWPVVQSSWTWIKTIWEELESRDLTYNTLLSSRFGTFPALPTLDVHYCSQIRRLSREDMIVQLLKSASELEDYAREAEYACANMISLLKPTFETYGIEPPSLPKPTPLTAYPLEFTAPQQTCPPWGQRVMEALNIIQASAGEASKLDNPLDRPTSLQADEAQQSLDMAQNAVKSVLSAFHKQDDEEKGARLGRKNMQVMDRLAKMEEHQRISIEMLDQASSVSDKAVKAADNFENSAGIRAVPLLKWSIVVGGATGACLVTANHILFITQLVPVIGGSRTSLFRLDEVDFAVHEGPQSLLNPLPTLISVLQRGKEVYSFRPSLGGSRLHSFLIIVQRTLAERTKESTERRVVVERFQLVR